MIKNSVLISCVVAELEVEEDSYVQGIEEDSEEEAMGIRLCDESVLVPIVAFQDLSTGQVYWTDESLYSVARITVKSVKESFVKQEL